MHTKERLLSIAFVVILLGICIAGPAATPPAAPAPPTPIENAFEMGWMAVNTNGDGIADILHGHVVVPVDPTAAENTAAANLATRLGYATTGLTMPVVVTASQATEVGPNIFVGKGALPASASQGLTRLISLLGTGEGGVYLTGRDLAFVGSDAAGLLGAAAGYASRAPYQWDAPGETLDAIAKRVNEALSGAGVKGTARLVGLTYVDREQGIHRAILEISGTSDVAAVRRALEPAGEPPVGFAAVRDVMLLIGNEGPIDLLNPNPLPIRALAALPVNDPKTLDLGELYTVKGLMGGPAKKPIPASVDARLYVPAGAAGVAMANLAARIGLETTGITLPLAYVPSGVTLPQVTTQAVLTADSPLGEQLQRELSSGSSGGPFTQTVFQPLEAGEGDLRTIDNAFGKQSAVVVRGDAAGEAAALDYAAGHLPFLWQPTKQQESMDEMRYDLHRFFSLRSSEGQATVAMYHLDQWLKRAAAGASKPASIDATVYVDEADPKLSDFLRGQIERAAPGAKVEVHTGSMHAGLKCCETDPPLHYVSPLHPFAQGAPTFTDEFTIPWEGRRLTDAVQQAAAQIERGQPVNLLAEVSEGSAEREKLTSQLRGMLVSAGADANRTQVEVVCAFKAGYSWLMDEIVPALKGQPVSRLVIEFAPNSDPEHTSLLFSPARWVQELYPVDEMLARALNIPLKSIEFQQMANALGPTYRLHAYAADGHELLTREFTVHTVVRPYSNTFTHYDHVQVDTGWVHLESAGHTLLDQRVETDLEMFWDHYQTVTLPRVMQYIMVQNDGYPKVEYQPLFDTLRLQIHLSEPDYNIGLDRERISSLESLQEDTFYSTVNYFYMLGTLDSTGLFDYMGRIIPVVYPSTDGQDGQVKIEFYAKDGPHPLVDMKWTDSAGHEHEDHRDLPALQMGMPQLVGARVRAGQAGVESLTWQLPVAARADHYQEWLKLIEEGGSGLDHTIFSAEQGEGQVHWLEAMHSAGLYPDSLAYPDLKRLAMEFMLPRLLRAPEDSRPTLARVEWAVPEPATKRPLITDYTPVPLKDDAEGHFVSWDEPIPPEKSAQILARLSTFPGVNVYWMGRSYLGENIWAADMMTASPAQLRSVAKEETLKAVIIYSARQHADEVSSTSHVLRLAEQLVQDPATRAMLKKVNVVMHPVTNPDGANLSIDLMHITPDWLLHTGYHASLSSDMATDQFEQDPIYPESRTRLLLWQQWMPDVFLNPHGYPSHEWVQPFSGYEAWVQQRSGVEEGRTWYLPRGWFTSLGYRSGPDFPWSESIAYELQERIADGFAKVPGAMALEDRMNGRYDRFGVRWEPRIFEEPITKGVRIYMALEGSEESPGGGGFMARSPFVTWNEGYTEAPDETAHQQYLHLVAGMGLSFDRVHLTYLADGDFKITRTEKEYFDGVTWTVDRQRPILPSKWSIQPGPGVQEK